MLESSTQGLYFVDLHIEVSKSQYWARRVQGGCQIDSCHGGLPDCREARMLRLERRAAATRNRDPSVEAGSEIWPKVPWKTNIA